MLSWKQQIEFARGRHQSGYRPVRQAIPPWGDKNPCKCAKLHAKHLHGTCSYPVRQHSVGWQYRRGEAYGWRQPAVRQNRKNVAGEYEWKRSNIRLQNR